MRIYLILIGLCILSGNVISQPLTGVKTIPGNYPTIAVAISDLNAQGVGTGGVTFSITAGYNETLSSVTAGLLTATGSAANPVIFQKSGSGSNPVIIAGTPGAGTMDYIFCLLGTDYITFDGLTIQENSSNTTATEQMEWGFAILKSSGTDGSQHVTIKNCTISLSKANTSSYGIYSNNHTNTSNTQLTLTASSGSNSDNSFFGNMISDVYGGIYLNGAPNQFLTPNNYWDENNQVGSATGNHVTNFAGGTTTSYGLYAGYQ